MIVRGLEEIMGTEREVDWGNGKSYRLLVESDGLGFAAMETLVRAGTESLLEYRNHLEACYCIAGEGEVEDMEGNIYRIKPGVIYALNHHDKHYLRADDSADMKLVSIFNPPLKGNEHHNLNGEGSSSY